MKAEQETIIKEFTDSLAHLDRVLEQVPPECLDWSEDEDEWTIRQILHHLAEDCNVYSFIIEQGLAVPNCKVFFGEFPGNKEWADRLAFDQRPVGIALELMHAHRKFLAELVSHFPERWDNKVNFYNESGEKIADQTISAMITMLTEHMGEHILTIQNILKVNLGSSDVGSQ